MGGIRALLFATKVHIKKLEVVVQAVRALRGISFGSQGCRKLLVDQLAVPMLVAAMKRHSLDGSLQHDGCVLLTELVLGGGGDAIKAMQGEKDGVEVCVPSI